MRKSSFIIIGIFCLALSGCEVEFDIKGLDSDPLLLMDGHVKMDPFSPGGCSFQMYLYGVPSAAGDREFDKDARCTLKVYKNSELIDTKDYITISTFYGLIADFYEGVCPGDEITITAESAGFPAASSRTVIPQEPPAVDVSYSLEGNDLKIRFAFEDDAATDDAYAICFRKIFSNRPPDDSQIGTSFDLSFGELSESSFLDIGPFDVSWEDGDRYYGIFDDTFNGRRKDFEVTVPGVGLLSYEGNVYARIEIQRISPERLRYEIACNDKGSNVLGFIGLSPVTFAYTNVSGGSGVFSSGNVGYSDWVELSLMK